MKFVDVLTLRHGKTGSDAMAYFEKALPVLERHGFRRLAAYGVDRKMRGHDDVNPSIVQIWDTLGPQGFESLMQDEEYRKLIPLRDNVFDMAKLQGWFATELRSAGVGGST